MPPLGGHRTPAGPAPRSRANKASIILTLVSAAALVTSLGLKAVYTTSSSTTGTGHTMALLASYLLASPTGWLLLIGLVQLLRRRPTGALIATAGGFAAAAYQVVADLTTLVGLYTPSPQATALGGASVLVQTALCPLLLAAGVTATWAGTREPRPRPASVTVGTGAALFLLTTAATGTLGSLLLLSVPSASPGTIGPTFTVGPWLSPTFAIPKTGAEQGPVLPWPGLALLLAVLGLAATAVVAVRSRALLLAGAVGSAAVYLAHHVILVIRTAAAGLLPSPQPNLVEPALYLLSAGVLLGMALAPLARPARDWFRSPATSPATAPPAAWPPVGTHPS